MEIIANELPQYLWEFRQTQETGLLLLFVGSHVATSGFNQGELVHFLFRGKTGMQAVDEFSQGLSQNPTKLRLRFHRGPVGEAQQNLPTFDLFCEILATALGTSSGVTPSDLSGVDYRNTVPITDAMKPIIREVAEKFFGAEADTICDSVLRRSSTLRSAFILLSSATEDEPSSQFLCRLLRERLQPLTNQYLPA